jgi:hypothetical protein
MKYIVNTVERRVENGEAVNIHGCHPIEASSETEARVLFRPFPGERIESVVKQEEIVVKKKKVKNS